MLTTVVMWDWGRGNFVFLVFCIFQIVLNQQRTLLFNFIFKNFNVGHEQFPNSYQKQRDNKLTWAHHSASRTVNIFLCHHLSPLFGNT